MAEREKGKCLGLKDPDGSNPWTPAPGSELWKPLLLVPLNIPQCAIHTQEKNRWKVRLLGERLISPLFEDSLDVIILTILPRLLCEGQRVIHLYPFAQLLCIATHQLLEMDLCFKCKKLHFQVRFDKPTLTPRMLFCLRFQLFCQASSHFWLQQNSILIHCFVEWRRCS